MHAPVIVWFRNDLRLADQPALHAALALNAPVLPVYIDDNASQNVRPMGAASRWWLHHSLNALAKDLARLGAPLLVLRGPAREVMSALVSQTKAETVVWNRRYDAAEIAIDRDIKADLEARGVTAKSFNGSLLVEPWEVTTQAGQPMKVFTPFWRTARAKGTPPLPLPAPISLPGIAPADFSALNGLSIDALNLLPTAPDWSGGMREFWTPGEQGAHTRLWHFLENGWTGYAEDRNRPDQDNTSRLSPHLRFGEISPRQIWHAALMAKEDGRAQASDKDVSVFQAELGWREFSYHLLFHNPDLARTNFQSRFDQFPWQSNPEQVEAWKRGRTGYPIVDAGMRQLWQTGWMHNRVRMIVGSFLIKHCLTDWRIGEEWFWDTLVDADPASNAASWQWVAGSGADAAPYFRIFNPVLQGERFDPDGAYVRAFVPELAKLPSDVIHTPWLATPARLSAAGVRLGVDYPRPIVDHAAARDRALAAFQSLKAGDMTP